MADCTLQLLTVTQQLTTASRLLARSRFTHIKLASSQDKFTQGLLLCSCMQPAVVVEAAALRAMLVRTAQAPGIAQLGCALMESVSSWPRAQMVSGTSQLKVQQIVDSSATTSVAWGRPAGAMVTASVSTAGMGNVLMQQHARME